MILKTYTRVFTPDARATLKAFQAVYEAEPHLDLKFGEWDLIGIGDVLIVGGTEAALAPIRGSLGPLIVEDLDKTRAALLAAGGRITQEIQPAPTGRFLYAQHADGAVVEYVEWTDELVERWIRAPHRAGRLSSQL